MGGKNSMPGLRYDRFLAGTAFLTLALSGAATAQAPDAPVAAEAILPQASEPPLRPSTSPETGERSAIPAAPAAAPAVPAPAIAPPAITAAEPAPEAAPDPFAALDPADRPIAEKVADLLNGKSDRIFSNRKERSVVQTFYENRKHALLWLDKGLVNARAKTAINRLNAAVVDALANPTVRQRLTDLGFEIPSRDQQAPEALAAYQKAEIEKWWPIIKAAGIKAE